MEELLKRIKRLEQLVYPILPIGSDIEDKVRNEIMNLYCEIENLTQEILRISQ